MIERGREKDRNRKKEIERERERMTENVSRDERAC